MTRITVLLLFIFFLLVSPPFAKATEDPFFSGVLKSRKVVGVIYFKKNSSKLSKSQQAEINRIVSLVISQSSSAKIVRVEGFVAKKSRRTDPLKASLTRAESVWYYLNKTDFFNSGNLYLTGFNASQSISELQGERVEIAIYDNPFNEKIGIYSSN